MGHEQAMFHPRYLLSWLTLLLLRMLALLPLQSLPVLATITGTLLAPLLTRRKRIIAANTRLCFPELTAAEQQRFVQQVINANVLGLFETAFSWWASDRRLQNCFTLEGTELVEQAQQQGRGILLLGLHFTTLDLAGRMLRLHHEADVTYRRQNDPAFNHFIEKHRRKLFHNMIEKHEMRRLVKVLKQGRMVWYAIDQNYGKKPSVFAPFFGQPAATLATTGKILRLTGAKPLLFSHYRIRQHGKLHYLLKISDPFGENFGDDEQANAVLLNRAYEQAIRVYPEQYLWSHRRFKTRPANLASVYAPKRRKR